MPEKLSSEVIVMLVGSTAIILMFASLTIISLFINQKRKYRHLQEKLEMKNTFNEELLRSHLEIQTQSFESISRELHDNVGTLISIAMVHIRSVAGDMDKVQVQKIKEADNMLSEAMDTLRDISKSINPENISRLGWQQSFINELERIRRTNLFTIEQSEEGVPFLIELPKQTIIFRILQETLNNIVKHSGGSKINVTIIFSGRQVTITIMDNGKGFDAKLLPSPAEGAGTRNMFARAAMLPALLEITGTPGNGTAVSLLYKEPFINLQ